MRDLEHLEQTLNGAILAQSRSYNQSIYGQSSSKDVVNKNFRPPLLNQDDFLPLSRQPRKLVVPRINPNGVAGSYFPQNERPSGVGGFLSDRVKKGEWRPTFFCPITLPEDSNRLVPDLELTLPGYSANAQLNTVAKIDGPVAEPQLAHEEYTVLLDPGNSFPVQIDGPTARLHDLPLSRPSYTANAGVNTPIALDVQTPLTRYDHPRNLPKYAASAGLNTPAVLDADSPLTRLDPSQSLPSYSAGAGINVPAALDQMHPWEHLDPALNRPAYSSSAGVNVRTRLDAGSPLTQLDPEPNRPLHAADARMNTLAQLDAPHPLAQLEPARTLPEYATSAGFNTPVHIDMESAFTQLEPDSNLPAHAASAGVNTPALLDATHPASRMEAPLNLPAHYSANAGINTPAAVDMVTPLSKLNPQFNRPQYSASAGINSPASVETPSAASPLNRLELKAQLDSSLVSNPGTTVFDGHRYDQALPAQLEKVGFTLPQVSYTVPAQTSISSLNNRTFPLEFPGMRPQLEPDVSSYSSSGAIPRSGVTVPSVHLRPTHAKSPTEALRRLQSS